MRIYLCENNKSGHRKYYLDSLKKIGNTYENYYGLELIAMRKNIIKYYFQRKKLIKFYLKNCDKENIIHILDLDSIYVYPIFRKKKNIIGTLHAIPISKIKINLLKRFAQKISYIVVHSKFLKKRLVEIGIKNVKVVNYPSFHHYRGLSKSEIRKNMNIGKEKIILSCLGSTRKNKGLNILLESLKYFKKDVKDKIIINISGEESDIKKEEILKFKNENIEMILNLKKLTDKEFSENIIITDIMIMPYLRCFGGNSGPMTEAVVNKIPCITPKELNIGKINLENNLGEVFECENSKSLAKTIERTIGNLGKNIYYNTDFYKELTEEKFLESYQKIYKEVWSELRK